MRYVEARPGPELMPFVECLWVASDRAARAPREAQRILPDGCPELIVHVGDAFSRLRGGRFVIQPRAFLAGTLTRPWMIRAGNRVRTLGVRFRPGAVPFVLPVRMDRCVNRETPLGRIVGPVRSARLLAGLRGARTSKRCFAVAEAWLLENRRNADIPKETARAPRPAATSRSAVAAILQSRGQIRMTEVARRSGTTPRQLERTFARALGIRPKLFARIVRLNAFLQRLGEAQRERMVDLALDAGYFDQAHLLRDFRSLAGRTPRRGRPEDGELARHFTLPSRLQALFSLD